MKKEEKYMAKMENIKRIVESYEDIQKLRIATGNRLNNYLILDALKELGEELPKKKQLQKGKYSWTEVSKRLRARGIDPERFKAEKEDSRLKNLLEDLIRIEKQIVKEIEKSVKVLPIWDVFLKDVKGVGLLSAGQLLAHLNPYSAPHISSYWQYCGLSPDGTKRAKGEKTVYNPKIKSLLLGKDRIGMNMLKAKSQYSFIYYENKPKEEIKVEEAKKKGEIQKTHSTKRIAHYRALRKMLKIFIAHLWLFQRQLEGLPTEKPYAEVELGHKDIISWEDIKDR